jgi:hypothetical protein
MSESHSRLDYATQCWSAVGATSFPQQLRFSMHERIPKVDFFVNANRQHLKNYHCCFACPSKICGEITFAARIQQGKLSRCVICARSN